MKKAYYARPMSIYHSPCEDRDVDLIRTLGFEPIDINKEELQMAARAFGMQVFEPLVLEAKALFFRSFPDGSIGAGVAQEIAWAIGAGIPVVEIPRQIARRTLSVEDTREMLRELGQR